MQIEINLPGFKGLELRKFNISQQSIQLYIATSQASARCPDCSFVSRRVHSQYERTLSDLPWIEHALQLKWKVRRFFCDRAVCSRMTFTEQLPDFAMRYARKTNRLREVQSRVAVETGAEMAKRILSWFKIQISGDQLLRVIRAVQPSPTSKSRIIGLDDWAFKKGSRYGTILVDLESQCVVDLLPDRDVETVCAWLQAHPEIEIVSRDRGQNYKDAIEQGAPQAVQIADRFHLLQNLLSAVQRMFERRSREVKAASQEIAECLTEKTSDTSKNDPLEEPPPKICRRKEARQPTRWELLFSEVKELQSQGCSRREVARRLGIDRKTAGKYFALDQLPERAVGLNTLSKVTPYFDYLEKRWHAGEHNLTVLLDELQEQGFTGSYGSLWRAKAKLPQCSDSQNERSVTRARAGRLWSPRQLAWLMVQRPESLTDKQQIAAEAVQKASRSARTAYPLIQTFAALVRERRVEDFDLWLDETRSCGIPELKRFAAGLKSDYDAVRNSLVLPWSNGPVEGQVHRLKLIKRQMYGRANFDLLRLRVLGMPAGP